MATQILERLRPCYHIEEFGFSSEKYRVHQRLVCDRYLELGFITEDEFPDGMLVDSYDNADARYFLFYDKHGHFGFEEWIGFHGLFGFVTFFLAVLAGKHLRRVLMRKEDYYDD